MKRLIVLLTMCCLFYTAIYAEDDVKVVIPTNKSANYALYPAITGVFLRLDTRDGTILAVVPSDAKKNRVLNSQPLTTNNKPGRFELYPPDSSWVWVLFDSETGDMSQLRWSDKKNTLSNISVTNL